MLYCRPPLAPIIVTPPEKTPVSLEDAKAYLHVEHDDDNMLIQGFVDAATQAVDARGELGRALITQTWKLNLWQWPWDRILLPLAPVQSITSVKYYDANNAQQTFASSGYVLHTDDLSPHVRWLTGTVFPSLYTRDDAIEVIFVAGYGLDPKDVPQPIRTALMFRVAMMYLPMTADEKANTEQSANALFDQYRRRNSGF